MNLITLTNPLSLAAEAYRTLRTNVYFASLETPLKTIVVTSPGGGENSSVVLANLAVVLAQAEKKIIAVDADLRHPILHELFGLSNDFGLGELLVHDKGVAETSLCETSVPGLQVLTSGNALTGAKEHTNALDLISSNRMTTLIEDLKTRADMVLFNTPPMIAVSDSAILASQTDGVLLVVELGRTRREHAQQAKDLLNRAHARLLGAVMANAPHERGLAGI